jgi:hypothetical protein
MSEKSRKEARAKNKAQQERKRAKSKALPNHENGQGAKKAPLPAAVSAQKTGDKAKEANQQNNQKPAPQESPKPSKSSSPLKKAS